MALAGQLTRKTWLQQQAKHLSQRFLGGFGCMGAFAKRTLLTVIIGVIWLLFCPGVTAESNRSLQKQTELGIGLRVGGSLQHYRNMCVLFKIYFISDKFFDGLRKKETRNGLEFSRGDTTYQNFPDHLIVDVEATVYKCSINSGEIEHPSYGEGLMSDPSFVANWNGRSSDDLRPAPLLSTVQKHQSPSLRWNYFLELSPKNIRLTDTLGIEISLRLGTARFQLSANLAQ